MFEERQQDVLELLSRAQKGELPWTDDDVVEMMGRVCSAQKARPRPHVDDPHRGSG